jgi:hypothetical protein
MDRRASELASHPESASRIACSFSGVTRRDFGCGVKVLPFTLA